MSDSKPSLFQRLLSPVRKAVGAYITRYHERLFLWHSETFYPLRDAISAKEWEYLQVCFALADSPMEAEDEGYDGYSYYTYSHRVRGNHVNSSRFAYGSVLHTGEALRAALPVIEERKLPLDPWFLEHPDSFFYGLGWDFEAGHFKVYFRVRDLSVLPQPELQTLIETTTEQRRAEGLVSYTWIGQELHESKVYVYPEDSPEQQIPGSQGRALMATSERGTLTQYDVSEHKLWMQRINDKGREIVQKYHKAGHPLDTIALQDNDHFTLYFPSAIIPFRSWLP